MTENERIMGVLDPAAIDGMREMVGGDDEFLADLIDTFLKDAPQMLADMRQALRTGDAEVLRRIAHSLKSNSDSFGATALGEFCRKLEKMGKANALEGADDLITRADAEFTQVMAALETVRQGL
jgi:HPt (histidine-containing phosphotransfer) domain-containing protein